MPERAGKHAHSACLQGPQVDGLVGWRLHLQRDAFQPARGDLNLLPRRQNGAAVGGLNQCVLAGADLRAQQHHITAARQNVAKYRHPGAGPGFITKTRAPGQRIGVAHAQG